MHSYEVNIKWTENRKGILSSPVLPQKIEVVTPPEFSQGIPGIWSPEHLFVAAINSCLMTTFLAIAENSKLEFQSFESNASCSVEKIEGRYEITEIILKPKFIISVSEKPERAKRIIEMSEKSCLISAAIKIPIRLEPEIILSETFLKTEKI